MHKFFFISSPNCNQYLTQQLFIKLWTIDLLVNKTVHGKVRTLQKMLSSRLLSCSSKPFLKTAEKRIYCVNELITSSLLVISVWRWFEDYLIGKVVILKNLLLIKLETPLFQELLGFRSLIAPIDISYSLQSLVIFNFFNILLHKVKEINKA